MFRSEKIIIIMEDNGLDFLNNFFSSEVNYFYEHYAEYDSNRIIEVTIATDSIYETAMHLNIPDIQKDILTMQGKDVTDSLNGTVVLCKNLKDDGVQIIISQHALLRDDGGITLIGTINHEFTHANDFFDFAEYLGITDSESVMQNDYWYSVQMWSEFHARRNGFLRAFTATTGDTLEYPDDYLIHEIELIKSNWRDRRGENELYELMQLCGRYFVLEELYPDRVIGFSEDMLKGEYSGIKLFVCNKIYEFCKTHSDFERFINDIDVFKSLIA